METLLGILLTIGLVLSFIEALAFGLWYKSDQYALLIFVGAAVGAIIPICFYMLRPTIVHKLGLWAVGGKDFFGSALFMAIIILFGMVVLGNILGALIGVIVSLKFFSN
jgi:hypothetical protein